MRDAGLNERIFSAVYPIVLGAAERAGQGRIREQLIGQASGRTLEIGAGNGFNLPYYPAAVSELTVSEPSAPMRKRLQRRLAADPPAAAAWRILDSSAEELPFADGAFDTIVASYVLCTVPDPRAALAEFARVLAPGGRYLFLEHVHAGPGTLLGHLQDAVERPHRFFGAGCHPNRRTERLLFDSPLTVELLEHGRMPLGMPTVRPIILGTACRD
ncbi:class I SAM-dependent methyltransferase [Sciscionella sediminilitoris]|uniref:class I SAM-dependent methyltransferase n=1 Tax=Sciscionella sediminilitoris TaxID=1445613 RepID=UPI0004DF7F1B|nr:class I SAM-dependent methyltransferase [Sciscionella sp. SE31]